MKEICASLYPFISSPPDLEIIKQGSAFLSQNEVTVDVLRDYSMLDVVFFVFAEGDSVTTTGD